jgi:hypothetical protein
MAAISDAFTVGVILLLIFGAIAFYLYTRIQQTEKRLNLCENILLDLKVASEHGSGSAADFIKNVVGGGDFNVNSSGIPVGSELESGDINELYERAIDAAYDEEIGDDIIPEMDESAVEENEILIEKIAETTPASTIIDTSKYDSMNVKELKNLAKQHQIGGASSMTRGQLVEALYNAGVVPTVSSNNEDITKSISAFIDGSEPLSFD